MRLHVLNRKPAAGGSSLLTSIEAYWKFDEASVGTRNDSHSTNHLTDNNSVQVATGKINNCAGFNVASSRYLSLADNAALSVADIDFSWAGWFYLDSKSDYRIAVMKGPTGAISNNYQISYRIMYDQGNDRWAWLVGDGSANSTSVLANTLGVPAVSTWYFIFGYHDATNNQIGISVNNGTVDTAAVSHGSHDSAGPLYIGKQDGFYYDGRIDELGMWKRKLSGAEVTSLYASGNGLSYPF